MFNLEAKVLGRLLVAHQTLEVMPDEDHMAAFIGQALREVPGVGDAHLFIGGVLLPSNDTRPDRAGILAACERQTESGGTATGTPPASGPFLLPLATLRRAYGFLVLTLRDADKFTPYLDFLKNTAAAIAASLEARRHLAELTRANNELGGLRRELESALNNSGAIQRSVVAAMAEGVCFQSSTGEIIAVNPAAARIHGCTAEQMMGRSSQSPPLPCIAEDGTPFPSDLQPSTVTLRTGQPQNDVVMGLCKPGGGVTWISINSQPLLREGQTRPYAVVTTFRNITGQKRAEEELLNKTDELDRFFTIAPDLLSIATTSGIFLRLSQAWERALGYSPEEMIGRQLVDFLHPDDVELTLAARAKLVKHKGVIEIINRYRCKDGSYRWFEWNATTAGGRVYGAARDITQRRKTEEELRDRTGELDRFFAIVPDLLSIASAGGYFLRLNPAWEETLGYSREELMRSQFTDFVHPEDVAATRKAMTVLAARKELINFTNRVLCKNGSYRWLEWSVTATNQQAYAAARDVTARKQAKDSLQLALQVGQIGTFEVDLASGRGTCTPELREIWGIPEDFDEAEFASFCWTHMHPGDVDRVREDFERILASHEAGETEFRIVRLDGSTRWLRWLGKGVQDHPGGSRWFLGVNMDITRLKRTDGLAQALNTINAKIHATIDVDEVLRHAASIGAEALGCDAAVIAQYRGETLVLSHALGFPDSVLGKRVKNDTHPRNALATRNPVVVNDTINDPDVNREQMRKWGIRAALIVPLATTDDCIGALFFSHRRTGVTFDDDDLDFARKLTSALSLALENARLWDNVQRQLAERANAEAALQDLNAELEARVAERTAQLVQAQKLEALGKLTGGVAHDFNNLLAVILGNMELLRKRVPGDIKAQRLVDNALQGAVRGAALTQRMLAFARRQDLRSGPVNLAELVMGLMPVLRSSLGHTVDIEMSFAPRLWHAWADANQLELALLNLAVNARDAMPNGGVLTFMALNESVHAERSDLVEGDYVRLAVIDQGTGMDEATMARAADPFFTTKGGNKGTGLGLSVVQGLASQLGGAMQLTSKLGGGTTVDLWLPRAADNGKAQTLVPVAEPRPACSCRVLVVDDDELMCMATADMLKDLGHFVRETRSGREALGLLKGGVTVDVVVTDYAMRGMTGVELAREIRARWPELPIILATGYAELPVPPGFDLPRLNKPFDQKALAEAICRLMPAPDGASSKLKTGDAKASPAPDGVFSELKAGDAEAPLRRG